jgi:hypothetical protein
LILKSWFFARASFPNFAESYVIVGFGLIAFPVYVYEPLIPVISIPVVEMSFALISNLTPCTRVIS